MSIPARPALHRRPNANRLSVGWAKRAKRRAKSVCCTSVRVGFASLSPPYNCNSNPRAGTATAPAPPSPCCYTRTRRRSLSALTQSQATSAPRAKAEWDKRAALGQYQPLFIATSHVFPSRSSRQALRSCIGKSRIRWVSPGGRSPQKASGQSYWNSNVGEDAVTSV